MNPTLYHVLFGPLGAALAGFVAAAGLAYGTTAQQRQIALSREHAVEMLAVVCDFLGLIAGLLGAILAVLLVQAFR